jgi:hypothetical protein
MEQAFGRDFGGVRVHTGAAAAKSTADVAATAYTVGSDIVFGAGAYAPGTAAGDRLLAHELAHTIQQAAPEGSSPGARRVQRTGAGNCARQGETVDETRDELALAGRLAHAQIQGFFSTELNAEVPIPRATKDQRSATCPPSGIPIGRADLWRYGGGLANVQVGEIKSINGQAFAGPDVEHYRLRLGEMAGRFQQGGVCPGPTDAADQSFDRDWLYGRLASGRRAPQFNPLGSVIPPEPTDIGAFFGDPLRKWLKCERRDDGGVIYWCVNRRLSEEEREQERVRLRIPVGEWERRTQPEEGTRAPQLIYIHPDFREAMRQLPGQVRAGRSFTIVAPYPLYDRLEGIRQMERTLRLMRVETRNNPVLQFRTLTWATVGVIAGVGLVGIAAVVVAAALPVAAGATAAGATAAGTGTAAATGGVVIPLFTATAAQEVAKAAAVVIIGGSLLAGSSEAQAATSVQTALADPFIIGAVDVTDDPHALFGGSDIGSRVTIDGRPYAVVGQFHSH